jgi:Lyzozyme M1 (1,4-beta-N-acetylmuramidase)
LKKLVLGGVLTVFFSAAVFLTGGNLTAVSTDMSPVSTADQKVIDISHYQTISDWSSLSKNFNAVYIKVSEGSTYTDPNFASNATSAGKAGMKYGFYHYFWPYADTSNAVKQADIFYNLISAYPYACVPVLDVEEANGMTKAQIVASVHAFADEFQRLSGQQIMIYISNNFIDQYLDSSFSNYKLWVANYKTTPPQKTGVWTQWTMWQTTGSAKVDGISSDGGVDLDSATQGIYLASSGSNPGGNPNPNTNTSSGDGYSMTIDKYYTVEDYGKTFNVTAAFDGGTMMVVTTLDTGEQSTQYIDLDATSQPYRIEVGANAVKSAVYLINGSFDGSSVPVTYGLTQFVTDQYN